MDKKIWALIILNTVMVIVIVITFFPDVFRGKLSPNPSELVECKTLEHNGDDKVNIVFFSPEKQAQEYADFLRTIEPLNLHQESFNFYYIDDYEPECEIYQGVALLCYNKGLVKTSASCPNDFIVVIQDENRKIRSSAYMNVMSINSANTKSVIAHEFAHVFANLADEYVPANLPKNAKNCVADCSKFSIKDGCFLGCSKADYFRSINNGLMRTLSATRFGIFNEMLITNRLTDIIQSRNQPEPDYVIKGSPPCNNEEHYLIHGKYGGGAMTIKESTVESGCTGDAHSGNIEYTLSSENGIPVKQVFFNPELIYTDSGEENQEMIDGEVFETDKDFYLQIPIIEGVEVLKIEREDQSLAQIDLRNIIKSKNRPCPK